MQEPAAGAQIREQMRRLKNEQAIFDVVEAILAEVPHVDGVAV